MLLELLYNRQLFLQFVDQRLGILKSCQEPGGFIMIRYPNLRQQESFYQLDPLWSEGRGTSFNQIECRWALLSYLGLTINQPKDIRMIERFTRNKINKIPKRFKKFNNMIPKLAINLNNLQS